MIRRWLLVGALCLLSYPVCAAELTQREWMVQLTDSLGWAFGLPDEPADEDYIRLLSGERFLRLEAESNHQQTDLVAVKHFTNYGSYSGEGWVSGLRKPSQLKLRFLLRHSGAYRLAAVTRLPGVRLQLAGREFVIDSETQFARHELGEIDLAAGQTEIVVDLPPQSGIDYVELGAPPRTAIAPIGGWNPDQPLTTEDLALTTLQALDLQSFLPRTARRQSLEVETLDNATGTSAVRDRHLGVPSGGGWLRAGNQAVRVQWPIRISRSGCYQMQARGSSEQPVRFVLPGILSEEVNFGLALASRPVGSFCVPEQQLELQVEIPAWAGIDVLDLIELDSRRTRLVRLIGLPQGNAQVTPEMLNELLELLSSLI